MKKFSSQIKYLKDEINSILDAIEIKGQFTGI